MSNSSFVTFTYQPKKPPPLDDSVWKQKKIVAASEFW